MKKPIPFQKNFGSFRMIATNKMAAIEFEICEDVLCDHIDTAK